MSYTIFKVKVTGASKGGPSSSDSETSLSTSDSARLKVAFPNGPQYTGNAAPVSKVTQQLTVGAWSTSKPVLLSDAGYSNFYKMSVLGGDNSLAGEGFSSHPISRDYYLNSPPTIGDSESPLNVPEGAEGTLASAGTAGTSVVASGLGPNVSTKGGAVVDASPASSPPFSGNGSASPDDTSTLISNGDTHGGGIKGDSPAST
jgi:hypothetical protein